MTSLTLVSPDQIAAESRAAAIERGLERGNIDWERLDLEEALTWLVMQAAVENPAEGPTYWTRVALSTTKLEDFAGYDRSETMEFCVTQAIHAANYMDDGVLVSKEDRKRGDV